MKECKRCHAVLPMTEFYRHERMKDGTLSFCKKCTKERVRTHRKENDSVRESDRKRYYESPKRRAMAAENTARWIRNNPEGYKAHSAVANALRGKRLFKQPCEVCGADRVHAHHEDYSKPLEVKWLCARHHAMLHATKSETRS